MTRPRGGTRPLTPKEMETGGPSLPWVTGRCVLSTLFPGRDHGEQHPAGSAHHRGTSFILHKVA